MWLSRAAVVPRGRLEIFCAWTGLRLAIGGGREGGRADEPNEIRVGGFKLRLAVGLDPRGFRNAELLGLGGSGEVWGGLDRESTMVQLMRG